MCDPVVSATVSASWASRSARSGSPCAIATRAPVVSAVAKCQPFITETASSTQRRAAPRSPRANATSAIGLRFIAARSRWALKRVASHAVV